MSTDWPEGTRVRRYRRRNPAAATPTPAPVRREPSGLTAHWPPDRQLSSQQRPSQQLLLAADLQCAVAVLARQPSVNDEPGLVAALRRQATVAVGEAPPPADVPADEAMPPAAPSPTIEGDEELLLADVRLIYAELDCLDSAVEVVPVAHGGIAPATFKAT